MREKLRKKGEKGELIRSTRSTSETSQIPVLTDPETHIAIATDTVDAIPHAWFLFEDLKPISDFLGLPFAISTTGDHARLLLKGPEKIPGQERTYKLTYWDPIKGLVYESKQVERNLDSTEDQLNWFVHNFGLSFVMSDSAKETFRSRTYDLTLDGTQLPGDLVHGLNIGLQNDTKNCIPLTFIAAAMRYAAAKEADDPTVKMLKGFFLTNFGISIYAKDEIQGSAEPKTK